MLGRESPAGTEDVCQRLRQDCSFVLFAALLGVVVSLVLTLIRWLV